MGSVEAEAETATHRERVYTTVRPSHGRLADTETMRVTREELYNQVWSKPMHLLAPRYGVSDVALAKRCKRLRIPVPGRGFWAKKTAGKPTRVIPLPNLPTGAVPADYVAVFRLDSTARFRPEVPAIIQRQIEFEQAEENRLVVSDSLRSAHPLVLRSRDALRAGSGDAGAVFNYQQPHLDIQVSRDCLHRSLLIMDSLIKAFEKREWKVSTWSRTDDDDRKSYVTVLGQRVPFGIRERLRKTRVVENSMPGEYGANRAHSDLFSGKLALVLRSRWGNSVEQSWADTDNRRLEDGLNDFMIGVFERAYGDLIWDAQREDSERAREAEVARQEAEIRRRDLILARIATLERQAENFQNRNRIEAFISAVGDAAQAVVLNERERARLDEWFVWAKAYSESLNPLKTNVMDVVEADATALGNKGGFATHSE